MTDKSKSDPKIPRQFRDHPHGEVLADRYRALKTAEAQIAFVEGRAGIERVRLKRQVKLLEKASQTDFLTQVDNRAGGLKSYERRIALESRTDNFVALIMIDADKFKDVNETYGHEAGDAVLKELATRLDHPANPEDKPIRTSDAFFRYGGEEFCAILSIAAPQDALIVAEKMRQAICDRPFQVTDNAGNPFDIPVSISLGVAVCDPSQIAKDRSRVFAELSHSEDCAFAVVQKRADAALKRAKEAGRNRATMDEKDAARKPRPKPLDLREVFSPEERSYFTNRAATLPADPG